VRVELPYKHICVLNPKRFVAISKVKDGSQLHPQTKLNCTKEVVSNPEQVFASNGYLQ
jgi:hypothetical protein